MLMLTIRTTIYSLPRIFFAQTVFRLGPRQDHRSFRNVLAPGTSYTAPSACER